jgi:predicted outer membrane protein
MLTALPRSRHRSVTMITAIAGALLGGVLGAPVAAVAAPLSGQPAPALAAPAQPARQAVAPVRAPAAHPSGGPVSGEVPNPLAELPAKPSAAGPVGPADRDLLVKVKLAGLWEMPASDMAIAKGASAKVKEVGGKIGPQHMVLDDLVNKAAAKLGVPLPTEPTPEQKGWLAEMQRASGAQFDLVFVERLRAAHGKIFPAIGAVRSGTRNEVVRELAAQANAFVLTHITLLESTGLVDYERLPLPPAPAPAAAAAAVVGGTGSILSGVDTRAATGGVNPTVVWLVLLAALIAGAYSMVRLIRPR